MDTANRQAQPEVSIFTSASASAGAGDAASSLRAAALLSRKRRKVASEIAPLRPAPEPSFQLDYGQDDSSTSPAHAAPTAKKQPVPEAQLAPSPPAPTSQMEDIEDGQIREEGEISDTETSPVPPPQRWSPSPPPRTRQRASTTQSHPPDAVKGEIPPPPPFFESPMVSASEPPDAHAWQAGSLTPVDPFVLETSTYRVDAKHVRPGLAMTQDQYNAAKDSILDLLGWAVPPEYLLECNLSRQVIFYVFTELNLRLPSNLDITGLIPYPTPEMLALVSVPPSLSPHSPHPSSSAMPPPSVIPARVSLAGRMGIGRIDTDTLSPDRSPYIKAEPISPSTTDLPTSLHMIEQQRRQELLARKAVIASRKARQSDSAGFTGPSTDEDVDMAAPQSVDDFLKTIEPVPHSSASDNDDDNQASSAGTTRFLSPERMDFDEPISGPMDASRNISSSPTDPSQPQAMSFPSTVTATEPSPPTTSPSGSTTDANSLRNNSARHDMTTSLDVTGSLTSTAQANSSFDGDGAYLPRRATKRPVAADFVDFDSGPGSSRGYANGGSYPNPLTRRKTGSFAGISGIRRCVIELSDSEDDGDGHLRGDYAANGDGREYSPGLAPGSSGRHPPRLTATPAMSSSLGFVNGNTGQSTPPNTFTSTTGLGAATLVEKEEEIKKMRQLIAQREELRLKKLAAMSGKSTLMIPPSTEAQTPPTTMTMNQEETPITSVSRKDCSPLSRSQDRELDRSVQPSNVDLITTHGSCCLAFNPPFSPAPSSPSLSMRVI
ncbi:hypothetical protein PAXRUDRAFT_517799 [Paxillus rubicundulus Ve08.2h10]|uniref:Uncharacterized protein n=1 Tax=Paxillus rubicundulus Ve08.2h10 TaxID=930991 RepID=A0A0D0DNF6_9AGAM|nr:hypothetical protein PAXRUDRAFT_517799 [Paxillus rubicundulus Ve08.2h10]